MNTHKDEIVEEIREEFFHKYYDQERFYEKSVTNPFFIDSLIKKSGIEKVSSAGLLLLSEMKEDEYSWLDNDDYGKPRESLKLLFEQALEEGYKKEIENSVLEMYDKGNPNCLFLFFILKGKASISFLEKLSKEMNKEKKKTIRFSPQCEVKRQFIENNEKVTKDLISKSKAQPELSLFSQPLSQSHRKTPVKS